MEWNQIIQILAIALPSLVVLCIVYFMMRGFIEAMEKMFHEEHRRRKEETKIASHGTLAPLRIQAYERMILFLERISPTNLVMRLHESGMTAHMLHAEILKTIRAEYEHNISQQVYLSVGSWEMIKTAKEETIKLINLTGNKMKESATGLDFGESLIQISSQIKKLPTEVAMEYLKKEFAENF